MSDAVMVPGLRDAAQAVVDRWETPLWKDVEPTAHVIARLRQALAASTPVGGWEDISTAPKDGTWVLACWHDATRPVFGVVMWDGDQWREADDIVGDPTHWMPLPPPPSVSIDNVSRPQEAVPTEQAVPPVVDCWKVGDYAERIEDHPLVKAGEVHEVVKMYRGGYLGFPRPVGGEWNPNGWRKVATPQPADGCSSNEGAGE